MGILGTLLDTIGELIVWARASADEADGRGQSYVADGETRNDVEHLALPGFYSCIVTNDELLTLRRDDGGVSIAARTARPAGAHAGDRGITTSGGLHVLFRGTTVIITGATEVQAGGTTFVALNGDSVAPDASFLAHTHTGVTVGPGSTGGAVVGATIGTVTSSATITKGA